MENVRTKEHRCLRSNSGADVLSKTRYAVRRRAPGPLARSRSEASRPQTTTCHRMTLHPGGTFVGRGEWIRVPGLDGSDVSPVNLGRQIAQPTCQNPAGKSRGVLWRSFVGCRSLLAENAKPLTRALCQWVDDRPQANRRTLPCGSVATLELAAQDLSGRIKPCGLERNISFRSFRAGL